jgi:hypothetical protein
MLPYKVMGTGCEQGYLEFVGNSTTIAAIQYEKGLFKTFSDDTLWNFMVEQIDKNPIFKTPGERAVQLRKV